MKLEDFHAINILMLLNLDINLLKLQLIHANGETKPDQKMRMNNEIATNLR